MKNMTEYPVGSPQWWENMPLDEDPQTGIWVDPEKYEHGAIEAVGWTALAGTKLSLPLSIQ